MNLYEQQLALEEQMHQTGIHSFYAHTHKLAGQQRESLTKYGSKLILGMMEKVSNRFKLFYAEAAGGRAGPKHRAYNMLKDLDPEIVSFITLSVMVNVISSGATYQSVAVKIAQRLYDEYYVTELYKQNPQYVKRIMSSWKIKSYRNNAAAVKHSGEHNSRVQIEAAKWGSTDRLHVGGKCLDLVLEVVPILIPETVYLKTKDIRLYLRPSPELMDWVEKESAQFAEQFPNRLPCVYPPKDWVSPTDGGYHRSDLVPANIFGGTFRKVPDYLTAKSAPSAYATLNNLQSVPWRINKRVLAAMKTAWDSGQAHGGFPARDLIPITPCPIDGRDKDALSAEEVQDFQAWKIEAKCLHETNTKLTHERVKISSLLSLAEKMSAYEQLYMVMQLDYRGRVYTGSGVLSYQGTESAKALLEFADGVKMGDDPKTAYYFRIAGAGLYGYDKTAFDDRIAWVLTNEREILAAGADPFSTSFWQEAKKPWQFLAWCMEYRNWQAAGPEFVTRIPCHIDGSCNGIQHFAAMLKDYRTGMSVNLVPLSAPRDIYQEVADVVTQRLAKDRMEADIPYAQEWLDYGVTRKIAKVPVMTLPYGGTKQGFASLFWKMLCEDERVRTVVGSDRGGLLFQEKQKACAYLAQVFWSAIQQHCPAPILVKEFLQEVIKVRLRTESVLKWRTPTGYQVVQAIWKQKGKRIKTHLMGKTKLITMNDDTNKADVQRHKNSIAANYVHSMDGSVLHKYVHTMFSGTDTTQVAVVHDSFGTPAPHVHDSLHLLKAAFIWHYNDHKHSALFNFQQDMQASVPLPRSGGLYIADIRNSDYFFC